MKTGFQDPGFESNGANNSQDNQTTNNLQNNLQKSVKTLMRTNDNQRLAFKKELVDDEPVSSESDEEDSS